MALLLSLSLVLALLAAALASAAADVPVPPSPTADDTALIRAYDASGTLVAEAAHPAAGEDGWTFLQEARDAGRVEVVHKLLGAVPVVYGINGVMMDMVRLGWCLSFDPAPDANDARTPLERRRPNVGLKEVVVRPGDTLVFELLKMGSFPARREASDIARAEAEAAREAEEAAALASDEDL